VGEESFFVVEAALPADGFVVEADGVSFQVYVKLHVLKQVFAHLVYEQHHELALTHLQHLETRCWVLEV
jgi:hypothetical protein